MRIRLYLSLISLFALVSISIYLLLLSWLFDDSSGIKSTPFSSLSKSAKISKSLKNHRLAVIVPFRDRFSELLLFVPHLSKFLNNQNIPYTINIINQNDSLRFNRASLINAGYSLVKQNCDYIAMHDVDLLPLNPDLSYKYPKSGPFHVSSPKLHPKYHYEKFVGGILLINNQHFELVNGLSNIYWGWGLEDDEFFLRLKDARLSISRPTNIDTGTENTFLHIHDPVIRKRDYAKLFNQKQVTRKRDRQTGLDNIDFVLTSKSDVTIEGFPAFIYSVQLICDLNETPWCDFSLVKKNKTVKPK